MYSITVFKPPRYWAEKKRFVYDNKTHRRMGFKTWDQFVGFLYDLSKYKLEKKSDASLITPALFKPNTTRSNKSTVSWQGWAAVDVDELEIEGEVEEYVRTHFDQYNYVCYSTASSTISHPKFRLVFALSDNVVAEKIKAFWYALNTEIGSIGDKQTKDLSRMYYIPATYLDAYNFIFDNTCGNDIDPDALIEKHPMPPGRNSNNFMDNLPEDLQEKVINRRKDQMTNKSYSWSHYSNCPFVNKKLINEYRAISHTDGSGRYAMIYRIMASIASNAIRNQYPITSGEIVDMIKQLDSETSRRYENRPLNVEANRAIEFAYRNM